MADPKWTDQQTDDWTTTAEPGDNIPVPFGQDEDLQFPETVAPADADEVLQRQRSFSDIPPGTHELVITGHYGSLVETFVNCTVKDPRTGAERTIGYTTLKVTLTIALATDEKASTLFDIRMPPTSGDPDHALAYWHGVPKGDKAQGWHAHTFKDLVDKAIAPWPQGKPMPVAARSFNNWVGRRFVGTIDPPEEYLDKKTGQPKMGKPKLNARSFRPAPGQAPLTGQGGQGQGGQVGPRTGAGNGGGAAQRPVGNEPAVARQASQPRAAVAPAPASDYKTWPM